MSSCVQTFDWYCSFWMSGSLAPVMYWVVRTTLCSDLLSDAVPSGDATGQDALDGAAIELYEDLGTHSK
jgi:hypothetical protein